jgi:hypothetical protein
LGHYGRELKVSNIAAAERGKEQRMTDAEVLRQINRRMDKQE